MMRGTIWGLFFGAFIFSSGVGFCGEIRVGQGGDYPTIQGGIDAANEGDVVIVERGVYRERISFVGKNISVCSVDPNDWVVVSETIIESPDSGETVVFFGSEGADSMLHGFTITKGDTVIGGGIEGFGSEATIDRCIISGNKVGGPGGGLHDCDGVISRCIIRDNVAVSGGAMGGCDGRIINCVIYNNTGTSSGGLHNCDGEIINCTIVNNTGDSGGGLYGCDGTVTNCIIRNNSEPELDENTAFVSFSCFAGGVDEGNIDVDPGFVDLPENNFRLGTDSVCIDVGTNSVLDGVTTDVEGNSRFLDGDFDGLIIVDIGAFESPASEEPVISLPVRNISFDALEARSNPENQILTIVNSGGGELDLSINEDCSWLMVGSVVVNAEGDSEVVISADISGLEAGDYSCELVVSGDVINSPQVVSVELHVEGPVIEVSETRFEFYARESGAIVADQVLTISNSGGGTLNWRIEGGSSYSWLEVGPVSGSVVEGADEVVISVDSAGLVGGDHVCELTVTDADKIDGSVVIDVCLHIGEELFVPSQYPAIQSAIDNSKEFDTIIVSPGIYNERIDFGSKNIVVRSTVPEDWGVVEATVIDGGQGGSVVTFSGSENGDCGLVGFTVRGGNSSGNGGGVLGNNTGAFIRHCVVEKNYSEWNGAGIFRCWGSISHCIVRENMAIGGGGAMAGCNGRISNCLIVDNSALGDDDAAGGLNNCDGQIVNCTIADNYSAYGVGLRACDGEITNCIISGGNGSSLVLCVEPSYSCFRGSLGNGNIDANAGFLPDGFRLSKDSACIDAGNNDIEGGLSASDLGGGERLLDGNGDGEVRVDMGAYEYDRDSVYITVSAKSLEFNALAEIPYWVGQTFLVANSGEGELAWEIDGGCEWLSVWPDSGVAGDEPSEVSVVVGTPGMSKGRYSCELELSAPGAVNSPVRINVTLLVLKEGELSVPSIYPTIQSAIDVAGPGDVVVVDDGVYTGMGNRKIDFGGKAITVRSENGPANCIIDCENLGRGFIFVSGEGQGSILKGLTIRGGQVLEGDNDPYRNEHVGGGAALIYNSSPSFVNCRFVDNEVMETEQNYTNKYGGGMFIHNGSPTVIGCVFSSNEASRGGGVYCQEASDPVFSNCVFSGNRAFSGGGIYNYYGGKFTITNCTVVGNFAAQRGGGITGSSFVISNSVFWDNVDESGISEAAQMDGADYNFGLRYNCIYGWSGELGGVGNIGRYPYFVDSGSWSGVGEGDPDEIWVEGDYHLKTEGWRWDDGYGRWRYDEVTSPCIDAGNPGMGLGEEVVDIAIDPVHEWGRNVRINMGAYGGTSEASMGPVGWAFAGDMTNDRRVDLDDVAFFFDKWLWEDCHLPGLCNGADFVHDGTVDFADFAVLAQDWLRSPTLHEPVAHWKFDGNYLDSVGTLDGTGMGESKFVTEYFARVGSGAVRLDGVNDFVRIYGYKGIVGGGSRSVCAWIKTADPDSEIISWGQDQIPGGRWVLAIDEDGFLRQEVGGGFVVGSIFVCDDKWHHVAVVLADDGSPDINEVRMYVDGVFDLPGSVSDKEIDTIWGTDVRIGYWGGVKRYFEGLIDDVRIYDLAISEGEIKELIR